MAAIDKPLAYIQNMMQMGAGSDPGDSSAPLRMRVEVKGFPPSLKSLSPGNYTLGASSDCDLIIPEAPSDEIALLHVRSGSEPHELVALSRGITLNGQPFGLQQRVPLMAETTLQVGGARITFTPRVNNFQRAGHFLHNVKLPTSLTTPTALFLVALVLSLTAWFSSGDAPPRQSDYSYSVPTTRAPSIGAVSASARLSTPDETATELNRLFRAADLASQVNAKPEGAEVLVTGAVDGHAEQRMNEILQLVGARTRVLIRSGVRPDTTTLIDAISGVALTPSRYIVLRDGERYRVGELMPNGWSVESIEDHQVIIARDGLHETLNLME
jgi:hypothetical protein